MSDFKFEPNIIDPLLNLIKDNQEYLTQKENLPQLAKLGYMYNTLWYAGRRCWGHNGLLRGDTKMMVKWSEGDDDDEEYQYSDCEENPKYKIEMCNPLTDEIEDLIYDAWGMHVSNDMEGTTFEQFYKLVKEGRALNDYDIKMLKINKTFDEWVEVLTDKRYPYQYENRKQVASHLLCTLGSEYSINKDGFIIKTASGADQDEALYGDWENAIFRPDIQAVVDIILANEEVKNTLNTDWESRQERVKQKKEEERKQNAGFYKTLKANGLYSDDEGDLHFKELFRRLDTIWDMKGEEKSSKKPKAEKYTPYYPISNYSTIYAILDEETRERLKITKIDDSYIQESIRICKDILEHEKEESEGYHRDDTNVKFAKKFLLAHGYTQYANEVPKEIDKYKLEKEVIKCFKPFTKQLTKKKTYELNAGEYYYNFTNTKLSQYGNNSYYFTVCVDPVGLDKGHFNSIEGLKNSSYYLTLKEGLEKAAELEGIKSIIFHFDNPELNNEDEDGNAMIYIEVLTWDHKFITEFENYLVEKDFQVGKHVITYSINDLLFRTEKPSPLGPKHDMNYSGVDCFSEAKDFTVYRKGKKICEFNIDERGGNLIYCNFGSKSKIAKWILAEHAKMKKSDKEFGDFKFKGNNRVGSDGKKCLYAHDLFVWLKESNNAPTLYIRK